VYGGATMITEHGLYLEEREIDLRKVKWLDEPYLRDMWIEYFYAITRWQYNYCKRLITLSDGNKKLMVNYGARPEKIQVIPNGINLERFAPARQERCMTNPRIIGFVGRVDSIKDIKTFIQAVSLVKKYYDQVQALVIGPTDERPKYYEECVNLVTMLELQETITFTGRVNVLEYYQKMDVLLLTSIKEGMPLVIIEAMVSGIPIVATDVGACKELLYGRADDTLGKAGIVTNIMDPKDIALGTLQILRDEKLANQFAQTGIKRIERFYSEELVVSQYREIYLEDVDDWK
jgi:glycosyltransferase involved in cell wall biosynthesis